MPQRTLFEGWDLTDLTIRVHLNNLKPGGTIHVELTDEMGKLAGARSVQWRKDRDVAGLPYVLQGLGEAFLWAPQLEAVAAVQVLVPKHMPEVEPSLD